MLRLLLLPALAAVGCASAGQLPTERPPADAAAGDAPAGEDLAPSDDLTTSGDLVAAIPALTDLTPQVTFIAVGKSFPIEAVFAARYFGNQPVDVMFASSDPAIVTVPASAQLIFNMDRAPTMAAGVKVGDATVTASLGGVMKTATVHVVPPVTDLGPSPLRIRIGQNRSLTVTLATPALPGGADIALASADPKVATVPAMVTIPQGMTTATFPVNAVAQGGPVVITASYAGSSRTAQAMAIDPVDRLVVSEVLYDATGMDDGWEWVELFNGGNTPVDLSGYFLGVTASSMNTSYSAITPALSGTLMPGGCAVIGGPMADPMTNALPMGFMYHQAVKFTTALPNGTATSAVGLALFRGAPGNVPGATIVDAVIYGTMQRGIADETGNPGTLDVGYVQFPKQTLERFGPAAWRVQNAPTGGACDWLHL